MFIKRRDYYLCCVYIVLFLIIIQVAIDEIFFERTLPSRPDYISSGSQRRFAE